MAHAALEVLTPAVTFVHGEDPMRMSLYSIENWAHPEPDDRLGDRSCGPALRRVLTDLNRRRAHHRETSSRKRRRRYESSLARLSDAAAGSRR